MRLLSGAILFLCALLVGWCSAEATWAWSRETGRFYNVEALARGSALEQMAYAAQYEERGDYARALKEYAKVPRCFAESILVPRAQFKIAECYQKLGRYSKAFAAYQVILDKYPFFSEPEAVLERQFAIASAFDEGRRKAFPLIRLRILSGRGEAVRFYLKIAETAPFSDLAPKGLYRAGLLLERRRRFEDGPEAGPGALTIFQRIFDSYRAHELADDALYHVGLCCYKKSRGPRYDKKAMSTALEAFRRYTVLFPDGEYFDKASAKIGELDQERARADFNVARFYEKQRDLEAAKIYYRDVVENYPLTVWAQKAEERLKWLEEHGS